MDFKKIYKDVRILVLISFSLLFINSCTNKEKSDIDNTYYIELVNFTKDSLKQNISENIFGKVAYYKKDKLQILSLNYVTDEYPNMHYFKNAQELGKELQPGTKKIRIEFSGEYTIDSISYSLQKFTYRDNEWVKTSDMGFIKATTTYFKAKQFAIKEFSKQIVNTAVAYTYN